MASKFKPRIGMKTVAQQGYSGVLNVSSQEFWFDAGAMGSLYGDSLTQYNTAEQSGISNLSISVAATGEFTEAHMLDPRINIDCWVGADTYDMPYGRNWYGANQGYAGQTSTTILNRIANVLEHPSQFFIYSGGTNDGLENGPAVPAANAQSAITQLVASGKKGLFIPIRPTGAGQNTPDRIQGRKDYEVLMLAWIAANYPNDVDTISFWDTYDEDGDDTVSAAYMPDALHPNDLGAFLVAPLVVEWMQTRIRPGNIQVLNANTELCTGFIGSGGTSGHANITGVIPAGWTVEFTSGSTALVSCSVDNGELVLAVTPGASSTTIRVRRTSNIAVTTGDWVQAQAEIVVTGESTGSAVMRMEDNTNPTNYFSDGMLINLTRGGTGFSTCNPWKMRSTGARPGIRSVAGAFGLPYTVRVKSISLKKKTSPLITWGAGAVPTVITPPTISGTPSGTNVLTATGHTYANNSTSVAQTIAYRWYADGVFKGSSLGTGSTFICQPADTGKTYTVGTSAANSSGRGVETISAGVLYTA